MKGAHFLAVAGSLLLAATATLPGSPPFLVARALLSAKAYQPGPPSGAFIAADNGVTPPFSGQPVPGFSAIVSAGGGTFLAMPDNGYGDKKNSGDFLLRVYRIQPRFRTARGGPGTVSVLGFVQLRDPHQRIAFPLFRADRLLTGADFDIESFRVAANGDLWFGDEFGPFLLHTNASGDVLEAPIALPGVMSPEHPGLPNPDAWSIRSSRGFEAMAISEDRKTLHPMLEGALRGDLDPRRRVIHEFDLRSREFTGRTWGYRVDGSHPDAVVGDMTALGPHRFVVIERDDLQGAEARHKRIYRIDLQRRDAEGFVEKTLVLDLLDISDASGISQPARPGEFGVGERFSYPLQSVESVAVLGRDRLLIANDNNYPKSDGRWTARDRPDDIELIVVQVPRLLR